MFLQAHADEIMIPIVCIAGASGSGKTRVAEALVKLLTSQGYSVAAIKHAPHGHHPDRPGSDTERFYDAGAAVVIASSPGRRTVHYRTKDDLPVEGVIADLHLQVDLVIAEGFSMSGLPKVLVLSEADRPLNRENIIATVGDKPIPPSGSMPHFTFQEMESLAALVRDRVIGGPTSGG